MPETHEMGTKIITQKRGPLFKVRAFHFKVTTGTWESFIVSIVTWFSCAPELKNEKSVLCHSFIRFHCLFSKRQKVKPDLVTAPRKS